MLTTAFSAAPLIKRSVAVRSSPMPLTAFAQRPSVLARPRQAPQQLSLFGPPGAVRR
ncbi:MAG TPA: hypothetical protein VGH48_11900 [Caldimonas sp.]|jgi:hypothetical protein